MELTWRVDAPATGDVNMQRDRADFTRIEEGVDTTPSLRVYGWSPPALSLGFHQDESLVDREALRAAGFDLVRRPTGGAAVLHHDEITYCVCAPLGVPGLGRGVEEIHAGIAGALVHALADHGIEARLGGGGRPEGFACFGAAGGHEITVAGRKLVGSALRRGRRAFLQHGSLLRGEGHLRLGEFLRADPRARDPLEDPRWLRRRTVTLGEVGHPDLDALSFGERLAVRLAERVGATARAV